MAQNSNYIASLSRLPTEILLDIYLHLDLGGVFKLCLVNKGFLRFFERRKSSILLPILVRDFHPFDQLLQVYVALLDNSNINEGRYVPRRVIFKRFIGDSGMLFTPQNHPSQVVQQAAANFTQVGKARRVMEAMPVATDTVVVTERDLDGILQRCRVVREWESIFPQLRWYYEPENCRSLRSHEMERFRKAFYTWWLYGIYFHGQFPRPRVGLPEPFVEDVRVSLMRHCSTNELLELMDLIETIKDMILHYIYPRLDPQSQQVS